MYDKRPGDSQSKPCYVTGSFQPQEGYVLWRPSMLVVHACVQYIDGSTPRRNISDWTKPRLDALRSPASIRFYYVL
jgi:hypothetical protein